MTAADERTLHPTGTDLAREPDEDDPRTLAARIPREGHYALSDDTDSTIAKIPRDG